MIRKPQKIVICVLLAGLLIIFTPLIYKGMLGIMGYPVDIAPNDLAMEIVESEKDVSICMKLQDVTSIQFTTLESRRKNCIFDYAKITKDPSACELLLPSEYGLACLSDVAGNLMSGIRCHIFTNETALYCKGDGQADLVSNDPQIKNCSLYKRDDVREWCHYSRTYLLSEVYECSEMQSDASKDECETGYAFKQKDPSLCENVKDKNRKKYCEIRINTWLKYPELRNSFYFGKKVPIDETGPSL